MYSKRILTALLISLSSFAQADSVGIEVGAYQWTPDYKGTVSVDDGTTTANDLDINDDLGFTDNKHNIVWASFEHPVPFLPNFKLVSSQLDTSASSTLNRNITFGNESFSASEAITTQFDMSNVEYTLYYELLDNWINLDAGLTFRQYDGEVAVQSNTNTTVNEKEVLDFTIPLVYLKGRVDLPLTGFFVDGVINIIDYDGNSLSDTAFAVGYESEIGLGGKAGYRTFNMDVEESDFTSDLKFKGAYVSVFFHF